MASSTTWTPESAPIWSDLRTASSAFSTAYSSSSDNNPSTPTRSTVKSSSNLRSAVASGTYFTQTTMFMVVWPRGPSCALGCGYEVTGRSASTGMAIRVRSLTVTLSRSSGGRHPVVGSGLDDAVEDPTDDEPRDRAEAPVDEGVLHLRTFAAELLDAVLPGEHVEVDPGGGLEDGRHEVVGL